MSRVYIIISGLPPPPPPPPLLVGVGVFVEVEDVILVTTEVAVFVAVFVLVDVLVGVAVLVGVGVIVGVIVLQFACAKTSQLGRGGGSAGLYCGA